MSDLAGLRVLVTRPGEAGHELAAEIARAGGRPQVSPALQIEPIRPGRALSELARSFPANPLSIFVSPNAVTHGHAWLQRVQLWTRVREGDVAAVGPGTARALHELGVAEVVAPRGGGGAAALLACAELAQVDGREVVIFRGRGGREILARTLRARGAHVRHAAVYRRACPPGGLSEALLQEVDIVIATSTEALRNLYTMSAGGAAAINRLPLLLASERAAALARRRGHRISPIITPLVSNHDIVTALVQWQQTRNRTRPG